MIRELANKAGGASIKILSEKNYGFFIKYILIFYIYKFYVNFDNYKITNLNIKHRMNVALKLLEN